MAFEKLLGKLVIRYLSGKVSRRTLNSLAFELLAYRNSRFNEGDISKEGKIPARLHLGCGLRLIEGWLNVDAVGGDQFIDFRRDFPFPSDSFEAIVSQHVIEHFDVVDDAPHIADELLRILKPGGILWITTPDMKRLCTAYVQGDIESWISFYVKRHPTFELPSKCPSQMMNYLFHQNGEHKNLFDSDLVASLLTQSGFKNITFENEQAMIDEFPDFTRRSDDDTTMYVRAIKEVL